MGRSLDALRPDVKELCTQHIKRFDNECGVGVSLLVYCTDRPAKEQAIIYRKSRTKSQIEEKMNKMEALGYPELARIINDVGPQGTSSDLGRHVTYAGPGESFHQYGIAYDAVPMIGGKADWNNNAGHYKLYGSIAVDLGLEWAGNWTSFVEFPHCQLGMGGNPLRVKGRDWVMENLIL